MYDLEQLAKHAVIWSEEAKGDKALIPVRLGFGAKDCHIVGVYRNHELTAIHVDEDELLPDEGPSQPAIDWHDAIYNALERIPFEDNSQAKYTKAELLQRLEEDLHVVKITNADSLTRADLEVAYVAVSHPVSLAMMAWEHDNDCKFADFVELKFSLFELVSDFIGIESHTMSEKDLGFGSDTETSDTIPDGWNKGEVHLCKRVAGRFKVNPISVAKIVTESMAKNDQVERTRNWSVTDWLNEIQTFDFIGHRNELLKFLPRPIEVDESYSQTSYANQSDNVWIDDLLHGGTISKIEVDLLPVYYVHG